MDRSRLRLERQLALFNVGPSASDDMFGLSFETLAIGGLSLASDSTFLEDVAIQMFNVRQSIFHTVEIHATPFATRFQTAGHIFMLPSVAIAQYDHR